MQVYRPINTLLNAWIFEGQLQDQYNEVFVCLSVSVCLFVCQPVCVFHVFVVSLSFAIV